MLDTETKRKIDSARDILVGKIPDPTAQVDQITTALIYKFMDDMDQESKEIGGKPKFFTGDFKKYSWPKIIDRKLSGQERLNLYMQAIDQLPKNEKLPPLFREIFKNAFLPYRDAETLNLFLKEINGFTYDHSENLGNAFEYLLSILGSQGDAGQFRTPRHIIDFIVEVIDPKKDESILDPACGTSGFLISSYKHIIKNNSGNYKLDRDDYSFARNESSASTVQIQSNGKYKGEKLTPADKKQLQKNIIGYDISPKMVKLSLVNMYLHNFKKPQIYEYDTLTNSDRWENDFNVILANPPFMSPKGGIRPHNQFSIQANRSEVLFVDYIAEHLTINGRAGIIVPEGIIFKNDKAYKALRKMLVENQFLWAVVSLPAKIFEPYSGVKTSVLFLDKKRTKNNSEILFIDVQNDGFDLGATRRKIDKNNLPEAFKVLQSWTKGKRETTGIAHWVNKKKMKNSEDYNLIGNRYKKVQLKPSKWLMVELGSVCNFINGKAFKPSEWEKVSKKGMPIIRIQNLNNINAKFNYYSKKIPEKYIVKYSDLLFSWSGSKGTSFGPHIWNKDRGILNQHIFKVEYSSKYLKGFLYLALKKIVTEVENNLHGGVGLVHITKGNLEKLKIPLPPIKIQEETVKEIESYQKIIDAAKQIIESWKPTIKIDPTWPMVKLRKICDLEYGFTDTAKNNGDTRFIRITDIDQQGNIIETDKKFINISTQSQKYFLKKNDILITRTGATFGKTALFNKRYNAVFASYLIRLRFKKNSNLLPYYYFVFSQSKNYWDQAHNLVTGGTQPQFNGNVIKQIKIPLPPIEMQKVIIEEIEKEKTHIESCKKTNKN